MATVLFHWIHECICRSVNCACFSVFQRHVREDPPVRSTAWIQIILKRLDAENTFSVIFLFLLCHLEVAGVFRSSLVVFERLYSQRVNSSLKTKQHNKATSATSPPRIQRCRPSCRSHWQEGGTSCTSSCAGRGCCDFSCSAGRTHTGRV